MSDEKRPPQLPRMPWYPSSFAASTRTWPLIARGVYHELLDISWDAGGLPAEAKQLQAMIGATSQEWAKAWPLVEPKFPICDDGMRRNPRLEEHRAEAIELHRKRHQSAKDAAAAKWRKGRS